jgi:hypothetical protein
MGAPGTIVSAWSSCDLCGASPAGVDPSPTAADPLPTSTDASATGTDALDQRRHQAPAGTDAGTGADGGAEADGTVPLCWVISVEAGRTRTYCMACSRAHLRSIEVKLDSDWW